MDRAEGALRVAEHSLREIGVLRSEFVKFSNAKPITSLYLDDDGDLVAVLGDGSIRTIGNLRGPQGDRGQRGERGTKGDPGEPGRPGEQGPAGPTGPQGLSGERGTDGERGPRGEPGHRGETGPTGVDGERGRDADLSVVMSAIAAEVDKQLTMVLAKFYTNRADLSDDEFFRRIENLLAFKAGDDK